MTHIEYVKKEFEIEDISMIWKIIFWDEGPTENYLHLKLCREELEILRDYLYIVTRKVDNYSSIVSRMIDKDYLYGEK